MAQPHKPVVQVVQVGDRRAGPLARPAHDSKDRVQHGDAEDEEGDNDGGEEKIGAPTELVGILAYD